MGFTDENGYPLINDEQKVRIALSTRAQIIIAEDMNVFGVSKTTSFINTVFENFRAEAMSSISLYLQQQRMELDQLFTGSDLDTDGKNTAIDRILASEKIKIQKKISEYIGSKGKSRLYHINNNNTAYLLEDCDEDEFYKSPGLYLRSIIEEYCSLPFIKRERIFKKPIYDIIEQACREKRVLKVKADYLGKPQLFYVYPYKIVPDTFHTQSYLACYSRKQNEDEKDKIVASFSMARINMPTLLSKRFNLNSKELAFIDNQLSNYSAAYLVGKPELIKVRLTERGKQSYQSRLYSRPEKIESLSTDDIYVFDCTQQQIFNYFFSFGADAEIIDSNELRNRFKSTYEEAFIQYSK